MAERIFYELVNTPIGSYIVSCQTGFKSERLSSLAEVKAQIKELRALEK